MRGLCFCIFFSAWTLLSQTNWNDVSSLLVFFYAMPSCLFGPPPMIKKHQYNFAPLDVKPRQWPSMFDCCLMCDLPTNVPHLLQAAQSPQACHQREISHSSKPGWIVKTCKKTCKKLWHWVTSWHFHPDVSCLKLPWVSLVAAKNIFHQDKGPPTAELSPPHALLALLNLPLFLDSDFNPRHCNEAKLPSQPWVWSHRRPLEESDKSDKSDVPGWSNSWRSDESVKRWSNFVTESNLRTLGAKSIGHVWTCTPEVCCKIEVDSRVRSAVVIAKCETSVGQSLQSWLHRRC